MNKTIKKSTEKDFIPTKSYYPEYLFSQFRKVQLINNSFYGN